MLANLNNLVGLTRKIEYLAVKNSLIYQLCSLYYQPMVKKEVELAQIKPHDQVLCIGGGPCPFTGIIIHQLTRAPVTIVDNDLASVRKAKRLIHQLALGPGVQVYYEDGKNLDVKPYSVIHFAAQVAPFDEVFNNVKEACLDSTRILVRLPKVPLRKLYGDLDSDYFSNCKQVRHPKSRNISSTALYVKAGMAYVQESNYCSSFGGVSPYFHASA